MAADRKLAFEGDPSQRWATAPFTRNIKEYFKDDFKSEKELCDYIDKYAEYFARDILEVEYKEHKREFYLNDTPNTKIGNQPRVDFLFTSKRDEFILVECKNPKSNFSELINSIGQLLAYYCLAKNRCINISRMCIIANKYDLRVGMIIKEFKLPIEFYILTKNQMLKLVN